MVGYREDWFFRWKVGKEVEGLERADGRRVGRSAGRRFGFDGSGSGADVELRVDGGCMQRRTLDCFSDRVDCNVQHARGHGGLVRRALGMWRAGEDGANRAGGRSG